MSSSTPNIGLTLPAGGENVSRLIINENNSKIDTYAGTLNSKILKPITVTVDPITNGSGSYNHTTSGLTLITEDMKAIDIEVGTPETFKAPVTVTTGNHTINISCPSVSGSSTVKVTLIHTQPVEGGQNVPSSITSTEFDILAGRIGTLSALQTSVKTDTVSAINSLSEQIGKLRRPISLGSFTSLDDLKTALNTFVANNIISGGESHEKLYCRFVHSGGISIFNGNLYAVEITAYSSVWYGGFIYSYGVSYASEYFSFKRGDNSTSIGGWIIQELTTN